MPDPSPFDAERLEDILNLDTWTETKCTREAGKAPIPKATSPGQSIDLLILLCKVVQNFHDTWPGDEPAESERQAVMDAMSTEVLAELSAHCAGSAPRNDWDAEARALLGTFTSRGHCKKVTAVYARPEQTRTPVTPPAATSWF